MTEKTMPLMAAAGLMAVLVLLVLAVPALMDWNRLRPEVESALSRAVGRPVRIAGPLSARLLPRPELRLEGLSLDGTGQAGARLLRLEFELPPLFLGRRELRAATLEGGRLGPLRDLAATLAADGDLTLTGTLEGGSLAVKGTWTDGRLAGRLSLDAGTAHAEGPVTASAEEIILSDLALSWGAARGRASLALTLAAQPSGTLEVTADGIAGPGGRLDAVRIDAVLDQGALAIGPATARLADGRTVSLEATARRRDDGIALAPLGLEIGDIRLDGDALLRPGRPLGLVLRLATQGIEGVFDGSLDSGSADGRLSLAAPEFAQAMTRLAGYQPRGAGPLALGGHVKADAGGTASLDGIGGTLGRNAVAGRAVLDLSARTLSADLTSPALHVGDFLPADGKPDPLERVRLDDAGLRLTATPAEITVERLTGRTLGGGLAVAGRANTAGWAASARLSGAEAGSLGLGAGPVKLIQGKVDAELRASARGFSNADLRTGLVGDGRFKAHDGVVAGFDLAAVNARLGTLENLGSLLGLVQAGLAGGQSRFSSLTATIKAERGIIASRDIALTAEGGGADGTATVDLERQTLDAALSLRMATPGSPPLGLRLSGPLSAPNAAFDVNAMQRYLVEHGLGKAMKGKAGGLLDTLLGGRLRPGKRNQEQ